MTDMKAAEQQQQTAERAPTGRDPGSGGHRRLNGSQLHTEHGNTRIADNVVGKVAGYAAREIPGVHSMGSGMSRTVGQLRSLVPGTSGDARQGVSVEVGEQEAAVDLDIVTWYGQSIVDVADAVRRNVIQRVEDATGLTVTEVNINVDDVFVEGDQRDDDRSGGTAGSQEARVR